MKTVKLNERQHAALVALTEAAAEEAADSGKRERLVFLDNLIETLDAAGETAE